MAINCESFKDFQEMTFDLEFRRQFLKGKNKHGNCLIDEAKRYKKI